MAPPRTTAQRNTAQHDRDADSQRIQFEFAEFAANSFAARIWLEIHSTANSGRIGAANSQATAK